MTEPTYISLKPPGMIDYLLIVSKRKRFVALFTLGTSVIVAGVSLLLPPVFSSSAKVLVPQESSMMSALIGQVQNFAGISGELTGRGTKIDLYTEILTSQPVYDAIIEQFKVRETFNLK